MRAVIHALAGHRLRWPLVGALALVLGASLVAAAQTLPGRAPFNPEPYCEIARASFERTTRWARDLTSTLEALDAEGPDNTAARLLAIRSGLEQEANLLQAHIPPAGAEEIRERGTTTLSLLLAVADPILVRSEDESREQVATFIREQFVAARTEARAAAAALRQHEPNCATRRGGNLQHLLGLGG